MRQGRCYQKEINEFLWFLTGREEKTTGPYGKEGKEKLSVEKGGV